MEMRARPKGSVTYAVRGPTRYLPRDRARSEYETVCLPRGGIPPRTARAARPRPGGRRSSSRSTPVLDRPVFRTSTSTLMRVPGKARAEERRRPASRECRRNRTAPAASTLMITRPSAMMWRSWEPISREASHRTTPATRTAMPRPASTDSARDGDGDFVQELGENRIGGPAVHGRLGRHDHPVGEHGEGQELDVIGDHVVAALAAGHGSGRP